MSSLFAQSMMPVINWALIAPEVIVCAVAVIVMLVPQVLTVPMAPAMIPDREVASYVRSERLNGNVLTWFDWGQYAIWHFGPDLKVSMDGRRETVYSDARLAEYRAILAGDDRGLRALNMWRAEYVWLPSNKERTKRWLLENQYRLEFDDGRSFLAVRADWPVLSPGSPKAESRRGFPR